MQSGTESQRRRAPPPLCAFPPKLRKAAIIPVAAAPGGRSFDGRGSRDDPRREAEAEAQVGSRRRRKFGAAGAAAEGR